MPRPELIQVKRRTVGPAGGASDSAAQSPLIGEAPSMGEVQSAQSQTASVADGTGVEPIGAGLDLAWKDGTRHFLSSKILRKSCPCATCQERRGDTTHQKPLSGGKSLLRVIVATADESENLVRVWPVGNYAIQLAWGDKHDSGIYTYELLYELSRNG